MQNPHLRIVFMGTPGLAAHVLQSIVEEGYTVVGVVTAPDRPSGRGRKIRFSAVKEYAISRGLPLLQPTNLKDPGFTGRLREFRPDLQVVVAFRMLPAEVWSLPPLGTFNLHASLLPDYRGAAPINWVIIRGENETGVTTFLIDQQIDTGNILYRKRIPLALYETAGSLLEKVKTEGAGLVLLTIEAVAAGKVEPKNQDVYVSEPALLNKAPKIHKEDCRIRWDRPCREVVNLIHGLSPAPGAFCTLKDEQGREFNLKLFEARPEPEKHLHAPGCLFTNNKSQIRFSTPDGYVRVLRLQLPGKKRMDTEELLRGYRFHRAVPEP